MSDTTAARANPLVELAVTIVIPAVILMKASGDDVLGPIHALLVALAFPLGWGALELKRRGKPGWMAALGLVSVVLTGGIGLLALDPQWLAIKEAAVPGVVGLAVLGSAYTRYPLVKTLLYNPAVVDVARVQQHLDERGNVDTFERRLLLANTLLAGTFFFSSAMNYALATWIVTSPAGSTAFNEELGRLTLLSYPMIALPSMLMMMAVLIFLARSARRLTGLALADMLNGARQ
ncbi:MAG: VC0807 family protein [Gammaproteobacteria bacterium]